MYKENFEVDHVVITQFRNDKNQPTLFANADGSFISVDNKEDFARANDKGNLKLSLKQAKMVVDSLSDDAELIEISPAFTIKQFKALINR